VTRGGGGGVGGGEGNSMYKLLRNIKGTAIQQVTFVRQYSKIGMDPL
jgi:hypothetical protein